MGAVCRIDLTEAHAAREPVPESVVRRFLGGRGANMAVLLDCLSPELEALAADAPLLFGGGPLVGTGFPSAARFSVSGRLPQTGVLGDSNAGGSFVPALRCAYD